MKLDILPIIQSALPIGLAALGEMVGQRSGVISIGLEGTMLTSAYAGVSVSLQTGNPWLGLLAAIATGVLTMLLTGVFIVILASDQVVVGTAVNLLALGVTGTLYRNAFGKSGKLLTVPKLPTWELAGLRFDPILLFTFLAVPILYALLFHTKWGLAVRSAGETPKATEAAGFSVTRLRLQALAINGAFAGLAGAALSLVIAGSFAENMTAGRGFVAIALVTFGQWSPTWILLSALMMGALDSAQYWAQGLGVRLPSQLLLAMPYAVALLVLVFVGKGGRAPQALGQPFRRSS